MADFYHTIRKKLSHRWIRRKLSEIARKEHTPHEVALGFSIGIFVGLSVPGLDIPVALLVILAFRNLNKLAVFFGLATINPLTTAFIYPFSYELGALITGIRHSHGTALLSLRTLFDFSVPLIVGNIILGLVLGIVSYFAVYYLYYRLHYRKIEQRNLQVKLPVSKKRSYAK